MRHILAMAMILTAALPALGQEKSGPREYPLRCRMEMIPKVIHYGDLVFAQISLTNEGDKTIIVPKSLHYGRYNDYLGCSIKLIQNDSETIDWPSAKTMTGRIMTIHRDGYFTTPGHSLKPGKSHEVGFRPLWVPLPEFIQASKARTVKQAVASKSQSFRWEASIGLHGFLHGPLGDPPYKRGGHANYVPLEGIRQRDLPKHGYAIPKANIHARKLRDHGYTTPSFSVDGGQFTIRPRPDEELALLNEWFVELAETGHGSDWHIGRVFAHPYYSARSPYKVGPELYGWYELEPFRRQTLCAQQLGRHRKEHKEAYKTSFEQMKTRTPEVEKRVARTKELEKQLLERADRPNSTISPMMKEFITLRGHLVEIRYANDTAAQSNAFDVMLDWVAKTKHQELWKKYLDKIVLNPRSHPDVLPPESFDNYRARLVDKK
ncbi:MAG: hypothetical protein HQ567_14505 [Candidatus Nealsonbacteria bacterium]|nr:hypothetical protein [Candidatus Nealsonbacteria bacterium]